MKFTQKIIAGFFALALWALLSWPALASDDSSSKYVLDNGLTVLVNEMPLSPTVSVYALVKTGSATEGKFLGTGITHFLEHMLFKGTHEGGVGELADRLDPVGGSINASTGMDYTVYTVTVPRESFQVALAVVADMMQHAAMDPEEVERERNVIFSEMRMRDDDPGSKLSALTFQSVYLEHPYRHPIIGYKSLLEQVTREDLLEYYRSRYVPNNMILSIAGDIKSSDALSQVKEALGAFKRSYPVTRNLPREPAQISPRHYEEEYPTDLMRLSMSFPSVALLHLDLYALDVLAQILGQGESSRLYTTVYKKLGLVHSITASNYTPMDQGVFIVNGLLEERNLEAAISAILGQIDEIKRKGVLPQELEKAKQQVRAEHILDQQTTASLAYKQALDEAFTGDHQFSKKYVQAIRQVTNEDVRRVAGIYLGDSRLTTVILRPQREKKNEAPAADLARKDGIQKYTLSNGLTVLLREDHALPLIAVQLAANGGTRQEIAEQNGISAMLASLWTKGTERHSSSQIAEITEGIGMQLRGFSGRNSLGLSMQFLTEQLPVALDLLRELIVSPTFPEEEMEKVKENMRVAIRARDDDIFQFTAHVLKETLFLTHPFRLEEGGTIETIDRITRDDIKNYYERLAVPGNMVLSVFGDIAADDVLKDIQKGLGALKNKEVSLRSYQEDPPGETREKSFAMDKQQAMVMFGFHGTSFIDDDRYGMEILSEILGSSFNGRLFMNIRERSGGAYTLGGGFVPGPDAGLVYFYVLTTEEEAESVKEVIKKEIRRLQTELIPDQELAGMKTYLKGMFKASQETNASLAFMTSLDELYGLGFDQYRQYDASIDAVTSGDLQRLAQRYLDLSKAAIVVTRPQK